MALSKFQRDILEVLLKEGTMSIKELSTTTGYSNSFVRSNVDLMVAAGELNVDKKRQPFVYDVPPESPEMRTRRQVEIAKEMFRKNGESTPFIKAIKDAARGRKDRYIEAVPMLRAMAQAIEEMEADGELIDTLEV